MKKVLILVSFLIVSIIAFSQVPSKLPQSLGAKGTEVRVKDQLAVDSAFQLPIADTIKLLASDTGSICYKNGQIYKWVKFQGIYTWINIKDNEEGILGTIYRNTNFTSLSGFINRGSTTVSATGGELVFTGGTPFTQTLE